MKKMLRGMGISILVYCVVIGIIWVTIDLCGGDIFKSPMGLFIGVSVICGIFATYINNEID
jgi:hypothetical protein